MAIVSGQSNASHGKEPEIFQNNPSPMQTTNSFKYPEMVSKQMPYCPTSNYKDVRDSILLYLIFFIKSVLDSFYAICMFCFFLHLGH